MLGKNRAMPVAARGAGKRQPYGDLAKLIEDYLNFLYIDVLY